MRIVRPSPRSAALPTDPAPDDLVELAFAMALEPHRFHLLADALQDRVDAVLKEDGAAPAPEQAFADVETHLGSAARLMERVGRRAPSSTGSRVFIDALVSPSFILDPATGRIEMQNSAAERAFGLSEGKTLPGSLFAAASRPRFREALQAVSEGGPDRFIASVSTEPGMAGKGAGRAPVLAISKINGPRGDALALLSAMGIMWNDEIGGQLMARFDLSDAETGILKGLVAQQSLANIAEARGRSVHTVRNQLKSLLDKLGLSSQVEAACFYASYSALSRSIYAPARLHPFDSEPLRRTASMARASGGDLVYEVYGERGGRPVLWLHSQLLGTGLNAAQKAEVEARGLRLILPWRPHFSGTDDHGPLSTLLDRYAEDLAALLEREAGKRAVPVMAANASAPYAFTLAARHPEAVSAIIAVAPHVPVQHMSDWLARARTQRVPYFMARFAPAALRMYLRTILVRLDAGYDEDIIEQYYEDSPLDRDFFLNDEMKTIARKAAKAAYGVGIKAAETELRIDATDWTETARAARCPVILVAGSEDGDFPPGVVRRWTERIGGAELRVVEDAGVFIPAQKPGTVFDAMEDALARAAANEAGAGAAPQTPETNAPVNKTAV